MYIYYLVKQSGQILNVPSAYTVLAFEGSLSASVLAWFGWWKCFCKLLTWHFSTVNWSKLKVINYNDYEQY